ncbi:hypothetical protein CI610_00481 [invertebrate metagenome]|uniref:Uncharacterized protein n=1 Tax=invertebrate metagenome TaxID=1711999 RepID=A0A2H9TBE0_9ZZZZ
MQKIPERDWKIVKRLYPILLQRYCQQQLDEINSLIDKAPCDYHQTWLELYDLVRKRNKEMSELFDQMMSRGSALMMLFLWKKNGLIRQDEWLQLSEETRCLADDSFVND